VVAVLALAACAATPRAAVVPQDATVSYPNDPHVSHTVGGDPLSCTIFRMPVPNGEFEPTAQMLPFNSTPPSKVLLPLSVIVSACQITPFVFSWRDAPALTTGQDA